MRTPPRDGARILIPEVMNCADEARFRPLDALQMGEVGVDRVVEHCRNCGQQEDDGIHGGQIQPEKGKDADGGAGRVAQYQDPVRPLRPVADVPRERGQDDRRQVIDQQRDAKAQAGARFG